MKFAHKSYLKPLLHATKYPTNMVNGVFLADSGDNVVDAVPFFHFWNMLTPMLEVAMNQVDLYCKANGLRIIGYYEASEKIDNVGLSALGQKIAAQILQNSSDAFAVVIKNQDIASGDVAFMAHSFKEGQWRNVKGAFTDANKSFELESASSPVQTINAIRDGVYNKLVDFDSHLENIKGDWLTNKQVE